MKLKYLKLWVIGLFSVFSLQAQEERTFAESIHYYIEINGTSEQYSQAIDQLFVMLKQQYADQEVPETVWTELQSEKEGALAQVKLMLASAYRTHFEHRHIKDCITFYESPAGRQYVTDPTQLSLEDRKAIDTFYSSGTGYILQQEADGLSRDCANISENWSTQLYLKMTEKLAEKGYHLNR